ncbi:uncharacterized protein [Argopecten irradians]|uniref:uncharacterized protein n=1 Tax=Argopecten irradians TaxID=31199 RepID=UPI0037236591
MVKNTVSKRSRQKYTTEKLLLAVEAVRQKKLSLRKTSTKYGVPVMIIQDRVKGKTDDVCLQGRPTVIPREIEQGLANKLKDATAKGFGLTRRLLAVRVARLCKRMQLKTPFRNGVSGKEWLSRFMKRHPDLSIRSPTALSTVWARMLNPVVTGNYFHALNETLDSLKLKDQPMKIWNIDETSVPLTHKPAKVIAETGVRNPPGRVGNSRDNVSVMACINAAGNEIPPMVIIKGKTYKSLYAYNTKEGVPNTMYTFQQRAWMEDALGELWFKQHFLRHCGPERPQMIFLDSHSSHETLGLIEAERENDITLLAFPPHTTQYLCPLDKTVFGPLSRAYSRVCSEFMANNPNNTINKVGVAKAFSGGT